MMAILDGLATLPATRTTNNSPGSVSNRITTYLFYSCQRNTKKISHAMAVGITASASIPFQFHGILNIRQWGFGILEYWVWWIASKLIYDPNPLFEPIMVRIVPNVSPAIMVTVMPIQNTSCSNGITPSTVVAAAGIAPGTKDA